MNAAISHHSKFRKFHLLWIFHFIIIIVAAFYFSTFIFHSLTHTPEIQSIFIFHQKSMNELWACLSNRIWEYVIEMELWKFVKANFNSNEAKMRSYYYFNILCACISFIQNRTEYIVHSIHQVCCFTY